MPNSSAPTNQNKFGLGQMMLIMAWIGLVFWLIRTTRTTRPVTYGGYSAIAVFGYAKNPPEQQID